jgi:hypothetical protein
MSHSKKKSGAASSQPITSEPKRDLLCRFKVDVYDHGHIVVKDMERGHAILAEHTCGSFTHMKNLTEGIFEYAVGDPERIGRML